ncbi:hypothetical protein PMAC_003196 [Pneumocystis sp. 'macacae']|nr:hypothetical protein PMAC_000661 [Pneumocystis sp. 'macacae']KAG5518012.1 hypothetical protein PMAC_003196 [Pneumocystis sp. 'macacae']
MSVCTRGGARGKKIVCTVELGWEEGVHQAARRGRGTSACARCGKVDEVEVEVEMESRRRVTR